MNKRRFAITISLVLLLNMILPMEASAKPPWWDRFKDIVVADALGALDGFVQTESLGGAIVGAIDGSAREGKNQGISGGGWHSVEAADESVGLHHNLGLNFYFEKGTSEEQDSVLLEYLNKNRIHFDERQIQRYLRGIDPTLEELLRRIREGTTGPFNPNTATSDEDSGGEEEVGVVVSDKFFSNLQQTLAILDGNADDPQRMLDEAVAFFINASLQETDKDLRDDIIDFAQDYNSSRSNRIKSEVDLGGGDGSPLDYDRIKITYEKQKSMGQPTDIILAWLFVDVLQHSAHYWSEVYCWGKGDQVTKETDNGSLWCWGANFERVMMDPDADPDMDDVFILVGDYLDLDDDGDTVPDTYETERTADEKAQILYELNLFRGMDPNVFTPALEGSTNRSQAMVMIARALNWVNADDWNDDEVSGFDDVPLWAESEVAYAVNKEITLGIGNNLFGSNDIVTERQLLTWFDRALGIGDTWSDNVNVDNSTPLIRENLIEGTWTALMRTPVGGKETLIETIIRGDEEMVAIASDAGLIVLKDEAADEDQE